MEIQLTALANTGYTIEEPRHPPLKGPGNRSHSGDSYTHRSSGLLFRHADAVLSDRRASDVFIGRDSERFRNIVILHLPTSLCWRTHGLDLIPNSKKPRNQKFLSVQPHPSKAQPAELSTLNQRGRIGPRQTLPPKVVTWMRVSSVGSNSTRWMFEKGTSSKAFQAWPLSRESQRPALGAPSVSVI